MHVYRPYLHPRQARALPVVLLAPVNSVGNATIAMSMTLQAAGVSLGTAAAAAAFAAQAQEGSFLSNGVAAASVTMSAAATGVLIGKVTADPVGMTISVSAAGKAVRHGEGTATVGMTMSVQAVGVRIVQGEHPGPAIVDMKAFVERKIERVAEYRFSSGTRTRDFIQRGH